MFSCRVLFWEREHVQVFKMEKLTKGKKEKKWDKIMDPTEKEGGRRRDRQGLKSPFGALTIKW